MTQWQHRREWIPFSKLVRELDNIGDQGWQLCAAVPAEWEGHKGVDCIFKRPKGKPK